MKFGRVPTTTVNFLIIPYVARQANCGARGEGSPEVSGASVDAA
jgi:hypothetical protein